MCPITHLNYNLEPKKNGMTKYGLSLLILLLVAVVVTDAQNLNVDSLNAIIKKNVDDTITIDACIKLTNYYTRKNLDSSLYYSNLTRRIHILSKYEYRLCRFHFYRGQTFMDLGVKDSSIYHLKEALSIAETYNFEAQRASTYSLLGHWENSMNRSDKALEHYLKSIKIAEQSKSKKINKLLPVYLNNVAILMLKEGKYKDGFKYIQQAYTLSIQYENLLYQGVFLSTMGRFYNQMMEYDNAFDCFEQAYNIKAEINDEIGMVSLLMNMGNVQKAQKNYTEANKYYIRGIELANRLSYLQGLIYLKYDQAGMYLMQKRYNQAINILESTLTLVKEKEYEDNLPPIYQDLATAYAAVGNYEKGYIYQQKYIAIQDTITAQQQRKNIEELTTKYEVDKKEQENKLLKSEQTAIRTKNRLWFGGVLVLGTFLILVLVATVWLYQLSQQRKILTESLAQKNTVLKELNTAKTNFFANISHEIKTPLTLIISPLRKLIDKKTLSEEDTFLVKTATQNSEQLFELTQQILELAKVETQSLEVDNQSIDFPSLVRQTAANFDTLALNQHINYNYQYKGNVPLYISTDVYKVKTIIKNLLSNALKYTNDNGTVSLTATEQDEWLMIALQDTGQGIRAENLPYIFDRFYQSKNPTELVKGGTGIGLTICKEYAEILGGKIEVKSEWGKGSTFTVIIPKKITDEIPIMDEAIVPVMANITQKNPVATQTILIIEDNLDMQNYLKTILSPFYKIITAPHGKVALHILKQQPIDLVITDLMMPIMNGYELMEAMKKDDTLANIPSIMLTALNTSDSRLKALRIGINDYLTKPFEEEELLLRIDYLLTFSQERKAFSETVTEEQTETSTPQIAMEDKVWLEELSNICATHFDNNNLKVGFIADEMAISHTQFWRKTQTLIGMSPSQYLQEFRLQKAREYLEEHRYKTIKQVGYSVGFKDKNYFSRLFKKRFGKNPSEFLK